MSLKPNDLLFVYGTLRKGGYWHHLIEHCEPVVTKVNITGSLFDIGRIPAVTLSGSGRIMGEVYKLPDQQTCDRIMSLERGYLCSRVAASGVEAWVFHMDPDKLWTKDKPIESGDWLDYIKNKTIREVQTL